MAIKRNDPCSCGSGKKYKKCCYFQDDRASQTQYFGYDNDSSVDSFFELPDDGLLCMVSQVVDKDLQDSVNEKGLFFEIGDWFVSEVIEGCSYKLHGPFENEDKALSFGCSELNVVTFRCKPELFND